MMVIHQQRHPNLDVPDCFACKAASVMLAPSAIGSALAREVTERERRWDKDIPAYKRLRRNGVQPPRIDGSAKREALARTREEVEA